MKLLNGNRIHKTLAVYDASEQCRVLKSRFNSEQAQLELCGSKPWTPAAAAAQQQQRCTCTVACAWCQTVLQTLAIADKR